MSTDTLRRMLRPLRAVFTPLAALFLLAAAWSARGIVEDTLRQAQWPFFIAATLLWAVSHLIAPALAWVVLGAGGVHLSYRKALAIHASRLPARYLPGGIWHTVSRVADYSAAGATRAQLTVLVAIENALPVALAAALGGGGLLLFGRGGAAAGAALALGLVLLAGIPFVLRHRLLSSGAPPTWATYARAAAVMLGFWITAALAFCGYWNAFPLPADAPSLPVVAAAYLLSWAAGFAMVLAPQGLGVFEVSIAALLRDGAGTPFVDTVVLAAGFRAAVLGADLLAYALYLTVRALRRRDAQDG
ncbi:hypothetical protein [Tahibacter caeni]|uniref:hypothetical protein n=1 Tax=Tahibacter caeni TaxID=1453545 RepID=UPI002148381C|nr:hypothetical protein [Tahibacter caeni]